MFDLSMIKQEPMDLPNFQNFYSSGKIGPGTANCANSYENDLTNTYQDFTYCHQNNNNLNIKQEFSLNTVKKEGPMIQGIKPINPTEVEHIGDYYV